MRTTIPDVLLIAGIEATYTICSQLCSPVLPASNIDVADAVQDELQDSGIIR